MNSLYSNSHVHSPYSFSAFSSLDEMVELAVKDEVKVLGINDFFSTKGFDEFSHIAKENKIYPLLNIEFLAFDPLYQHAGIRVNDPFNPGRMYFVGKGLQTTYRLTEKYRKILETARLSQISHIKKVIDKVNDLFFRSDTQIQISYEGILANTAKDFVGERHVAQEIKRVFKIVDMSETDIRNKILKRGGPAYVEEEPSNFLTTRECIEIISGAGGLPCYPVLFDYGINQFTEFEQDLESMYKSLSALGVRHLDVMPDRNNIDQLMRLVEFLDKKGFYILFGTEHNTQEMKRVRVTYKGGAELSQKLVDISYRGCCSVVAHQSGLAEDWITAGDNIIKAYT